MTTKEETPGIEQEPLEPETLEEAEQTPQELEVKEDLKPRQPASELKVIIIMKADSFLLGVQSPDCDPVYKTCKGAMADALQLVPVLVAEANLKWQANPRYPKADLPAPPPSPTPTRTPVAASTAKTKNQPKFF